MIPADLQARCTSYTNDEVVQLHERSNSGDSDCKHAKASKFHDLHTCWRRRSTWAARSARERPASARSAARELKPAPSVLSAAPTNSRGESTQATRCLRQGCSRSPQSLIGRAPALQNSQNAAWHTKRHALKGTEEWPYANGSKLRLISHALITAACKRAMAEVQVHSGHGILGKGC